MAIKAFELFGTIDLQSGKLQAGLKSASNSVSQFEAQTKNSLKNVESSFSNLNRGFMSAFGIQGGGGIASLLGSAGGNAVISGVKSLASYVKESVDRGIEYADMLQSTKIAFINLLGDKEKGLAHVKELVSYGVESAFQTKDVLQFAQSLESVGVKTQEVIPMLKSLGDAAAAAGNFSSAQMESSIRAVYQMLSQNRVGAQEMTLQLAQVIPNPYGYMARGFAHAGIKDDKGQEMTTASLKGLAEEGRLNAQTAVRIMLAEMEVERKGLLETLVSSTVQGSTSVLEDKKSVLYAMGMMGVSDLVADPGPNSAYAQKLKFLKAQADIYDTSKNPDALNIAQDVGQTGGFITSVEDTFAKLILAPKAERKARADKFFAGLGEDISGGLTGALNKGADGIKSAASAVLGNNIWDSLVSFWETNSPSKKTIALGVDIGDGLRIGLLASLEALSKDPRIRAMLDVIGFSEGTDKAHGYATKVGGGNQGDLSSKNRRIVNLGGGLASSASGRYQFLNSTWDSVAAQLGLSDFSEHSQDLAAIKLLKDSGALQKLQAGDFPGAVQAARKTWASFPGAGYGQGEKSMGSLEKVYAGSMAIGGSPVTASNPVPVQIIDAGNAVPINLRTGMPVRDQLGGAHALLPDVIRTITAGPTGKQALAWGGSVSADLPALIKDLPSLAEGMTLVKKPLQELVDVNKTLADSAQAGTDAFKQVIAEFGEPYKGANGKKDKHGNPLGAVKERSFETAFTREGMAGDFTSGMQGLLSGLGWEKPGSLFKQFGVGMIKDIQGRLAHDMSSMITESIFGTMNKETHKMEGGLFGGKGFDLGAIFSKLFGSIFGGHRASGGSMSSGRLYIAGENGPEAIYMGGSSGYAYNNQQTRGMMGGGEQRTIVAFGDRAIGEAVEAHGMSGRGRRARIMHARYMRKLQSVSYA
jgi:muramidase (phage lysozyme)